MKALRIFFLLLILVIALLSCNKSEFDYYRYPMKMGNSWNYRYTFHYYNTDTDTMADYIDTVDILVDSVYTNNDGEDCFRLKSHYGAQPEGQFSYTYVMNNADGFYKLGTTNIYGIIPLKGTNLQLTGNPFDPIVMHNPASKATRNLPQLLMPYKYKNGMTWTTESSENQSAVQYTIDSRKHITVPAGSFDTIKRTALVLPNTANPYNTYISTPGTVQMLFEAWLYYSDEEEFGEQVGPFLSTMNYELMSYHLN